MARSESSETFEEFGLHPRFIAQAEPSSSPISVREYVFKPRSVRIEPGVIGRWLRVRVLSEFAPGWVGRFLPGPTDYKLSGLFALPSRVHLCVIANGEGYVVPINSPTEWEPVSVGPVIDVCRVRDRPIVVFADFQNLAAYGPQGLLWKVENLSLEDIVIRSAEPQAISGTCYVPVHEAREFSVEPLTGIVTGGWENAQTTYPV
jgi:hypothetical protein